VHLQLVHRTRPLCQR